jgi:hypothetical protein
LLLLKKEKVEKVVAVVVEKVLLQKVEKVVKEEQL